MSRRRSSPALVRLATCLAPSTALLAVAAPASAAPPAPVLHDILPSQGGPSATLVGSATPGASLVVYGSPDCTTNQLSGSPTTVGGSGAIAFSIPLFAVPTTLSAHVSNGSGTSPCSRPITYYPAHAAECPALPDDLPQTRPPIQILRDGNQAFLAWADSQKSPAATEFGHFLDELADDQPVLSGPGGNFSGELPFSQANGVVRGVPVNGVDLFGAPYELYGNGVGAKLSQALDAGVLDPSLLDDRLEAHQEYMASYEGLTKRFTYMDFGTALFGNHATRTGFFDFYDNHWDAFDSAGFDLGTKPEDPTRWLSRSYHDMKESADYPDLLTGLHFEYGPVKPESYGDHYRYAVNIQSEGWALYWKQMVQWAARAGFHGLFMDNVYFRSTFNAECQVGYLAWAIQQFGASEADRLLSESVSLMMDPSFEWVWSRDANGVYSTPYLTLTQGGVVYPDIDSVRGAYSARLQHGKLSAHSYELAAGQHTLTFSYKTGTVGAPGVGATADVWVGSAQQPLLTLDPSGTWTTRSIDVTASAGDRLYVYYTTTDKLWIDEQILTDYTLDRDGNATPNYASHGQELYPGAILKDGGQVTSGGDVRFRASMAYWDSVVDDRLSYLRDAGREIDPTFFFFTNSGIQRRGAEYFMFERQALAADHLLPDTKYPPGVYPPNYQFADTPDPLPTGSIVTNAFDYKYVHARRLTDTFAYGEHDIDDSGLAHNLDSLRLLLGESAAFGGGLAIDTQLSSLYYRYSSTFHPPSATLAALRDEVKTFDAFTKAHSDLFSCLRSHAEVGFLVQTVPDITYSADDTLRETIQLSKGVAGQGVLWDVLVPERLTATALSRYRAVVVHRVDSLSEAQAAALASFAAGGGLLIVSGTTGTYDELGRLRAAYSTTAWPPVPLGSQATLVSHGAGKIAYDPAGVTAADVVGWLGQYVRPSPSAFPGLSGQSLERMRIAAWEGADHLVVHLLDYDVTVDSTGSGQVKTNVAVAVPLPASGVVPTTANIYDPATNTLAGTASVTVAGDVASFVVPSMKVAAIVDLH